MEYFAIYAPSAESKDAEEFVFDNKTLLLQTLKNYKDARFKSFKSRSDALKFASNGANPAPSILDVLKSPPPNQPPMRSLEKSNFVAPKSQELVKFRKEIEQNNLPKVYEMINLNPRFLVSSGDTPSILKEGPRYNALHVAAMNKHDKMVKLILQTVEQTKFIELLHGIKNHPNAEEMSQFLLESYLNTPDKSRNETPLHFASKVGAVEVIKVLISYPLCKMKPNSEGLLPKDIICSRLPDGAEKVKLIKEIEDLLEEKFFVPVLRSTDSSTQAQIGKPFSPANMPKFSQDPMSPTMEIKAYAGPMSLEQAQTFHKRLKTPPRLTPTAAPSNLNLSFSPKSFSVSSPFKSPRMSKSLSEIISSTPKHKKKLFESGGGDEETEEEELYLDNINGNHRVNAVLNEHEEEEFKEILEDLLEEKIRMEMEKNNKENIFRGYRNPEPVLETPIRGKKNDTNSNHLNLNFNCSGNRRFGFQDSSAALMTYLDESGSIYNSDNVCESPSFKEKHIRLTDIDKGIEKIGRELAMENNVGWKEYWTFLGRFLDIRSEDGLQCFENFLKQKAKLKELNDPKEEEKPLNDSFGLSAICAGFNSLDLNEDAHKFTRSGLTSPSASVTRPSLLNTFSSSRNVLPLSNPYSCLEQSCRTFSKRLLTLLESETVQDQNSYEKILMQEANKLKMTIDSYKRDLRFNVVAYQKVHARYSFLLVSQLKRFSNDVKYLRTFTSLISKVYALASQYTSQDASKSHAVCLSRLISGCIEKQDKIFSADSVDTETACIDAWNGPDIVECSCLFDSNPTSVKHRREIRKKLYNEKSVQVQAPTIDVWSRRIPLDDDEDLYLSCSDSDSEDEKFYTPPSSPSKFYSEDDDDMNDDFEESMETFEDEDQFKLFIESNQPSKIDYDVLHAFGESFVVDDAKYPLVYKWLNVMKQLNAKAHQNSFVNNFRIFTPKLQSGFSSS